MNSDPVLIDDEDTDMEQPVVVVDEDDEIIIGEEMVSVPSVPTVETIVLDDETPIITGEATVKNNALKNAYKSEMVFVNNLKNNRLMDKIVTKCINMENAVGMPRVIYKTLLPLYRDTNNTFKESDLFRTLLKKTFKLLTRDPDHKFLHIKTLCEELKSGGLRRKVPFVTLATNLKNNGSQWDHEELTSRDINQNNAGNRQIHKVKTKKYKTRKRVGGTETKKNAKQSKKCTVNRKDRIKTRSITQTEKEKTDIIDLDDSETESVDLDNSKNDNCQNDVIIIEETEPRDQSNNDQNTILQDTVEKDSNKENNDENCMSSDNGMDYELLIPKSHVQVSPIECEESEVPHSPTKDLEKIARLEKLIANYKGMIDKFEEAEVTSESPYSSAYYLSSKYKENLVECYKQICEIKGNCKDIVKRREIRLHVADGHSPGPAKMLESFLNSTIDSTGAVEFPDFSDVVKCVVESNQADNLAWNRQQVIQEAVALFRQCGQALRKRRQKREYKDLLSLIRDKEEIDDPAEKDPILFAKLEENKLIAKKNEEELLERYVSMENNASSRRVGIPHIGNTTTFESDKDSSGSDSEDSESEQNITLPSNITISTTHQPVTGECSRSYISLDLLLTNNTIVTSASSNSQCVTGQSSKTNDVIIDTVEVSSTAAPSTLNPILRLLAPSTPQNFVQVTIKNENQCAIRESSIINDAISISHLDGPPTNTISSTPDTTHNERETIECSDKEEINSKLELTTTETVISFNTTAMNENCEISSISSKNIENTELRANNEPCYVSDVQNNISSTTDDGVNPECDSSINTGVKLKTEDSVKSEPLDIQSMLDELGDGFVCQVFDIEDPFLVIEISSDGFSDDDEL